MQRLTFHRYLERYVRSLSHGKTNSIFKLANEVSNNPRLKEPLFLYSFSVDKVAILLRASVGHPVCCEYTELANKYKWNDIIKMLEDNDTKLNHRYQKVYRSYVSKRDMPSIDNDTRRLMHKKTRKLQDSKSISNYRIYTDLGLNQSNVNAYLKSGDISRISKATAEKIIAYLETYNNP